MMKFFVGLVVGFLVVPVGTFFYFWSGRAPVATAGLAMPFEKRLAHMALNARVEKEMPKTALLPVDEANFLAGAQIYKQECAVCHGLPGQPTTNVAKGMYPKPPQLFHGHGVTDDDVGETYWKVANGIRLTGMPGFKQSLSDEAIWQVSLLLANADKVSPSVKTALNPSTK